MARAKILGYFVGRQHMTSFFSNSREGASVPLPPHPRTPMHLRHKPEIQHIWSEEIVKSLLTPPTLVYMCQSRKMLPFVAELLTL